MTDRTGLSRGDRNRNARLARLRVLLPPGNAIVGIDLATGRQAVVVADHDSRVLGRTAPFGLPHSSRTIGATGSISTPWFPPTRCDRATSAAC